MRRALVVLVLAILAVVGAPPLGAVGSPRLGAAGATRVAVVERANAAFDGLRPMMARDICDTAQQFVDDAQPQKALKFIDGVRYTQAWSCLDVVERKAEAAVAEAQAKAEEAETLASTDPTRAEETAQAALKIDADNQLAGEVLDDLKPATPVQSAHVAWEEFLASTLTPLGNLALPVAGVLLGVFVLARVAALLRISWRPSSRARRRWAEIFAVLLAVAVGTWLATGFSPLPGVLGVPSWASVLLLVLVLAAAVLLAAYALATRLRVSVEVRDKDGTVDEAGTGHVVALLAELGGEDPRGTEVARGTDVSVLDEAAISGLSKYPVVGLLTTVLQVVLGITPWRVRVDVESPDRHAVTVTRNGRTVAAGVVDRDSLRLRTPRASAEDGAVGASGGAEDAKESEERLPDLHVFAAAMALVAMAPEYVPTDFVGLYGVRDWRSLALTDVATRFYDEKRDKVALVTLLNHALEDDPANLPAAVALHHARHRYATTRSELDRYRTALDSIYRRLGRGRFPGKDADPMRARVLLTYLVVSANFAAAPDEDPKEPTAADLGGVLRAPETKDTTVAGTGGFLRALQRFASALTHPRADDEDSKDTKDPATASDALVDLLRDMKSRDRRTFAKDMAPSAASLYLFFHAAADADKQENARKNDADRKAKDADRAEWAEGQMADASSFSPLSAYNGACLAVHRGEIDKTVELLEVALEDPTLRTWAARDPELRVLKDKEEFRKLVAPARQEFLGLSPVKEHAAALRRAGLGTPEALAGVSTRALARHLAVDPLVARHLREMAGLWVAIPANRPLLARFGKKSLDSFQGQVFTALLTRGVGLPRALHCRVAKKLANEVADDVQEVCGANVRVSDSPGR